jgi:excinuclease ABC subunit C
VDDFKSMAEVVFRRYRRLQEEGQSLPDLVMIDGGRGQLGAAMQSLTQLGLENLPVFGLAKRLEEFYLPGRAETLRLSGRSPGRLLIQRLRDEAHRFAIQYHRSLRSKALRHSELDEVAGVGPKTKKRLLEAFGSLEGVKSASLEALGAAEGIGRKVAETLYARFHDPSQDRG